jgi:hypothetical protein
MKGYWMRPEDVDKANPAELKKYGITDLFILVSRYEDRSNYYAKFLPKAIKKFGGIRVHSWSVTFMNKDGSWHSPKDTAFGDQIVAKLVEIAKTPGLAGIHLDYVRYPGNANGDSASVTNFVAKVRKAIPNKILSAAVMPEYEVNAKIYGQDYGQMGKHLDYLLPMTYRGNFNQPVNWVTKAVKYMNERAPNKIIAGILTYHSDKDTSLLSEGELKQEISAAINGGAKGFCLFRYGMSNYKGGNELPTQKPAAPKPVEKLPEETGKRNWDVSNVEALISRKAMVRMINRYKAYKAKVKKEPSYVLLEPEENNYNFVTLARFTQMLKWYMSFEKKFGTGKVEYIWINCPKNVVPNGKLQSKPPVTPKPSGCKDYYEQKYAKQDQHGTASCGPTSLAMALSSFGIKIDHADVIPYTHTTPTNTNPVDIIAGATAIGKKYGMNITGHREKFNERWDYLGQLIADPNKAVILHGHTSGWRKYYIGNYGHYVYPVHVNMCNKTINIADPARSWILSYTFSEFLPGLRAISQPSMIILEKK